MEIMFFLAFVALVFGGGYVTGHAVGYRAGRKWAGQRGFAVLPLEPETGPPTGHKDGG